MILTGKQIQQEITAGNIKIDPFDAANLNPNSYDVRIGDTLKMYVIDPKYPYISPENKNPHILSTFMGPEGLIISPTGLFHPEQPHQNMMGDWTVKGCFLAATMEYTETKGNLVPMLHGRSSWARLFLDVHKTAGFGDVGFRGTWTLELVPHLPVLIKPGYKIAQLAYHRVEGDLTEYKGKYLNQIAPTETRLHQDFNAQKEENT